MKFNWVGGILIALITLVLSDIWREARPIVFGWRWGDVMHRLATEPFAHYMLAGILVPIVCLWVLHRRFEFDVRDPFPYLKIFLLSLAAGELAVLSLYILFGKAGPIMHEIDKSGAGFAMPFIVGAVTTIYYLFKALNTGDGLKKRETGKAE